MGEYVGVGSCVGAAVGDTEGLMSISHRSPTVSLLPALYAITKLIMSSITVPTDFSDANQSFTLG